MFAIRNYCGNDDEKFFAFSPGILAVQNIIYAKELSPWIRTDREGGTPAVHVAIWRVAATMPIVQAGDFDVPEFCRRVSHLNPR